MKKDLQTPQQNEFSYITLTPDKNPELSENEKRSGEVLLKLLNKLKQKYWSLLPAFQLIRFQIVKEPITHLATDGEFVFYHPGMVYRCFQKKGNQKAAKQYSGEIMHIVIHGILGHFWMDEDYKDRKLCWGIMDLLVEHFIRTCFLKKEYGSDEWDENYEWEERISGLLDKGMGSYFLIRKKRNGRKKVLTLAKSTAVHDNHLIWHKAENEGGEGEGKTGEAVGQGAGQGKGKGRGTAMKCWKMASEEILNRNVDFKELCGMSKDDLTKLLERGLIAAGFGQGIGTGAGDAEECFQAKEDPSSYTETLKKLCRETEAVHEEPDSLDYMLYQYGLDLYGDVPLIEPLEENPHPMMETMVFALDTSGSCYGEIAERFLGATRRILQDAAALGKIKHIYFVECDDVIQKVTQFQKAKEMENYVSGRTRLHGYGGTSFVPVFDWIRKMREKREFSEVTALFYLTDGFGVYPDKKPDYPVYFVFPEEDFATNQTNMSERKWIHALKLG